MKTISTLRSKPTMKTTTIPQTQIKHQHGCLTSEQSEQVFIFFIVLYAMLMTFWAICLIAFVFKYYKNPQNRNVSLFTYVWYYSTDFNLLNQAMLLLNVFIGSCALALLISKFI